MNNEHTLALSKEPL